MVAVDAMKHSVAESLNRIQVQGMNKVARASFRDASWKLACRDVSGMYSREETLRKTCYVSRLGVPPEEL